MENFWEKYGRSSAPYLAVAILSFFLDFDSLGYEGFFIAAFILGSLNTFWEISNPKNSAQKAALMNLITVSWMGGPAAAMLLGVCVLLFGGALGLIFKSILNALK